MTKRLMLVAALMTGCGGDGKPDPHEIVDCSGIVIAPTTECEAACVISMDQPENVPHLPRGTPSVCTGTNVNGETKQCDPTLDYEGNIGCCDRATFTWFDCEEGQ
jgi:hypothetical protein